MTFKVVEIIKTEKTTEDTPSGAVKYKYKLINEEKDKVTRESVEPKYKLGDSVEVD